MQITAILLSLLLMAPVPVFGAGNPGSTPERAESARSGERRFHPRRVIVTYKPGASLAQKETARRNTKAVSRRVIGPRPALKRRGAPEAEVLMLAGKMGVETAVDRLREMPGVASAEPDHIFRALYAPNDPGFSPNQWHLRNTGQTIGGTAGTPGADIGAPGAWDIAAAGISPAVVAVIDTGIDLTHPDLSGNLWANTSEIPNNGMDDDGNGYTDDYQGYNWAGLSQWEFANGETQLGGSPFYGEIAQSFRGNGGKIYGVGVDLYRYGSPDEPVTVSIRSSRTGGDLASFTAAPADVPTSAQRYWFFGSLSAPVVTADGDTYYLVLKTANNNESNYYAVANSGSVNGFPDGALSVNDGGWSTPPQEDMTFELMLDGAGGHGGRPRDDQGHGTHVGGIVAAQAGNSIGVAGVAGYPAGAARIMPLRVLDTQGSGYYSDITEAIYYAADNGADVINMSLGGPDASPFMQAAVDYAAARGVFVAAASGNNATYSSPMTYPAGLNNVIGVGATTNQDAWASFSTHNSSVDLSAPGHYIYSTMPTYANHAYKGDGFSYAFMSGTSMATPVVAGAAALLKAVYPNLTPAQIEQRLRATAVDLGAAGRDDKFGSGRIDLGVALANPAAPSGPDSGHISAPTDRVGPVTALTAPRMSTKISTTARFRVAWSATDPGPASGVDSYTVRFRPTNSRTWANWLTNTKATSAVFAGRAGRTYFFRVRARDNAGNTGWSPIRKVVVPYNEGGALVRRRGFNSFVKNSRPGFYFDSVRYSTIKGHEIIYKFNGNFVGLVTTLGQNRGRAKIYVDGRHVKNVDAYSSKRTPRRVVFSKRWNKKGNHTLKIVNLATPGRPRFDIDAIAVGN